jgi:hypothetical protein
MGRLCNHGNCVSDNTKVSVNIVGDRRMSFCSIDHATRELQRISTLSAGETIGLCNCGDCMRERSEPVGLFPHDQPPAIKS